MRPARRSPLAIGVLAAELAVGAFVLAPPASADDGPDPAITEPTPPASTEPPAPPTLPAPRSGRAPDPIPVPSLPDLPDLPDLPAADTPTAGAPTAALPSAGPPSASLRTGRGGQATPTTDDTAPAVPDLPVPSRGHRGKQPAPTTEAGATPAPAPASAPAAAADAPQVAGVPAAGAPPAHTVVTGESLWQIAAAHLATTTNRDRAALPVADVAAYWVRVCDANRARLRSGDLDLIFEGEVVDLPPI